MSPDELARWVTDSCEAQGVAVKITDSAVLAPLGALLAATENG